MNKNLQTLKLQLTGSILESFYNNVSQLGKFWTSTWSLPLFKESQRILLSSVSTSPPETCYIENLSMRNSILCCWPRVSHRRWGCSLTRIAFEISLREGSRDVPLGAFFLPPQAGVNKKGTWVSRMNIEGLSIAWCVLSLTKSPLGGSKPIATFLNHARRSISSIGRWGEAGGRWNGLEDGTWRW